MRGKDHMDRGEGERLHAQRQKKFWKLLGALAIVGGICGFIAGFVSGFSDAKGVPIEPRMMQLAAIGVIAAALAAIYFSWRFFVSVDEVEVADNLWGSLIGFYVYGIAFPAWWALNQLGAVGPVDHWLIYGVSMLTALAVYAWRKWQQR